jgi:hypothetical protein
MMNTEIDDGVLWRQCNLAVPGTTPLKQLMNDAMIFARAKGYDVFNALDLLQVRTPAYM